MYYWNKELSKSDKEKLSPILMDNFYWLIDDKDNIEDVDSNGVVHYIFVDKNCVWDLRFTHGQSKFYIECLKSYGGHYLKSVTHILHKILDKANEDVSQYVNVCENEYNRELKVTFYTLKK